MVRPQVVQHVLQKNHLLLVIYQFSVSLPRRVDNELARTQDLGHFPRPSLQLFGLDRLLESQAVEHELLLGDLPRLHSYLLLLDLELKLADLLPDVGVVLELLDGDPLSLLVLKHQAQHVEQGGVHTVDLLGNVDPVLLLYLLEDP